MANGKKNSTSNEVIGTTRLGAYEVRQDKNGDLFYYNVLGQKVPVYQGQYDPYFSIQNSNQVGISKGNYQGVSDKDFSPELSDILGNPIYPQTGYNSTTINLYNSFEYLTSIRSKYNVYASFYNASNRDEKVTHMVERLMQIKAAITTIANRLQKDQTGLLSDNVVVGIIALITKNPLSTTIISKVKNFANERTINTRTDSLIRDYSELIQEKKAIEDYLNNKQTKIIIGVAIAIAAAVGVYYYYNKSN